MKIKTKLIISFCIIIFVPSILAIATISAYCNFQSHVIEQTYGIKNADAYSIINSVPLLNRYTALDFEKIKKTIKLSPSKMEDAFYLTEINEDALKGLEIVPVKRIEEVLRRALLRMPEPLSDEAFAASMPPPHAMVPPAPAMQTSA